jgi:hypothetical protein
VGTIAEIEIYENPIVPLENSISLIVMAYFRTKLPSLKLVNHFFVDDLDIRTASRLIEPIVFILNSIKSQSEIPHLFVFNHFSSNLCYCLGSLEPSSSKLNGVMNRLEKVNLKESAQIAGLKVSKSDDWLIEEVTKETMQRMQLHESFNQVRISHH